MRRMALSMALVLVLVCGTIATAAAGKKYGKALTIKETTKVSDIFAKPDAFNGKRVKVQGPVVDVCSEKGCWIAIGSDKEFQSIRFKVDDGVIVFPMDAKGLTGTVEGVISVTVLSVEEQIAAGKEMAKESSKEKGTGTGAGMGTGMGAGMNHEMGKEMGKDAASKKPFDPKSITGPKTVIMIKGEAAEIF
ncbi:MAG: DUF4920 domain-containing protein [Acidobacteriota bacterium]